MNCLVCGSKDKRFLFIGKDRLHAIPGSFPVVKCRKCGLIMLDPQPSQKMIAKYYPARYHAYARYDPGSKKEHFAVFLYKLFFKEGGNPLLKLVFLPFKHLLRGTKIISGGKILDVGCGNGSFLYKMRAAGMDAYGVELSAEGAKEAQRLGLDVKCGTLEQQKYPSKYFDVITLNHVLEHVADPVKTLQELGRILKQNGTLIIAVPNSRSLARFLFGRYWASLDVPRHLTTHNVKTMCIAARKAGLKVKKVRYISFPFQFQASFAYLLHPSAKLPLDKTWLGRSRLMYWLLFPLVYAVDLLHIGDVIEVTLTN
ncbi:MAG: class I SAM-dependent methyltransferase [Candidatus Woesearchaeota archaeon]